jgi:Amt family ammonium transporter
MDSALNTGDTAWMLTAAAMVLLMIPGLAFFYGGMVRSKSVLNMLMMVMGALFIVGVLWVLFGYSMTFGTSIGGVIGDPTEFFGLESLMADDPESTLPIMAFVAFQGMFACLTVGLIAGAIPDRTKFNGWLIFGGIWAVLVYFPVAHWVWASGGWIFEMGVRRWHGRSHQCRSCRSSPGNCDWETGGMATNTHASAQFNSGHDRRRIAVVRLVWIQCGLGTSRE